MQSMGKRAPVGRRPLGQSIVYAMAEKLPIKTGKGLTTAALSPSLKPVLALQWKGAGSKLTSGKRFL